MLWKPKSVKLSVKINFIIFILMISLLFISKIQSATIISNCMSYSSDGTKCLVCVDYYHTFDGKCYPDVNNCKTYSSGTTCSVCASNNFLLRSLNKCCDSVCLSQFYVLQQNPNQQVSQILAQSSLLEAAIDRTYSLINLPISSVKLLNISYIKYFDVSRYFFFLQLSNSSITFHRFVFDYHYSLKQFILIDDSSYSSSLNTNFSQIFYSIVKTSTTVSSILQMFPTYYSQTDINLALIKFSNSLNKITTYEIVLHNQNIIRGLYLYKNLTVLMYQTLLKPLSYRRILFGKYIANTLNNVNYLSQSESILDTNEGYNAHSNLSLKALVLVNSSSSPNYQRLTYFSQNSNSIVKSQFQVLFTSLNNFKISLISLINQRKSESFIPWSTYFENQSPQINKILLLLFSGFNSTLQIPDNYVDDSSKRSRIEWNLTIEQWKVFKRFYIRIEDKNGYQINATLVYLDYFSEYRIQSIVRTGPAKLFTASSVYSSSSSQSTDLNSQNIFTPFEHTIQGWSQIYNQSLQRQNIKKLLLIISTLSIHKTLGSNSSIIILTQKTSLTHNNYTSVSQNITHYLNLSFVNISSNNNLSLVSSNFRAKKQLTNPSPFFVKSDPTKQIEVYYRDNMKTIIYNNLTAEPASSLLLKLKDAWLKHMNDNKTLRTNFLAADSIPYLLTLFDNFTDFILQTRECPTSPTTTFVIAFQRHNLICNALHFQQITDFKSAQKNILVSGSYRSSEVCSYRSSIAANGYLIPKINTSRVNTITYASNLVVGIILGTYNLSLSVNTSIDAANRILKELSTDQNSSLFDRYRNFRVQNYSRTYTIYNYYSGFILNNFFMTDTTTNLTYEFVYYYRARNQRGVLIPLPSHLQSIKPQYLGICPPINIRASYMTRTNQQINPWTRMNSSQFFQNYEKLNPTGIFADSSITIKNLLYSQNDRSKLNNIISFLPKNIQGSNYEVKQYIKIQYATVKIYLWRLLLQSSVNNIASINQQDLIIIQQNNSLSNLSSTTPQLISWSPFVNRYLETYNIKTRSLFTDYIPIELDIYNPLNTALYLQNTSGIANLHAEYYKDNLNKLGQADNKINQEITSSLLAYFPGNLSSLTQNSYQISFKKVFYRTTNITNETSLVTFILEVQNKSTISSQQIHSTTFYLKLSAYIKSNSSLTVSNKIYNTFIFILNIQSIQQGSNLNSFITQSLYPPIQTISNYSVGYNYKFYNDSKSSTPTNYLNTSGSSSGNTTNSNAPILVSSNSNQTVLRFYDIMSDKGKLIQAGQFQSIQSRVFETTNYSSIISTDLLNVSLGSDLQKRLFNTFVLPEILPLLQSQQKAINLTISRINNFSILLIQKVFDSSGFVSFNIIIRVNVTVNNSSVPTFSLYLIRFTYVVVSNPFSVYRMGTQFISTQQPAYSSFITNLNSTSNLYFKPLQIVSKFNYLSAFMYSTLDMINRYISDKNISQTDKAIKISRIYYRGFIQGGFYKIVFETKEQFLGMGYMIEDDYQYSVLLVKLTDISTKSTVNNTGTINGTNSSINGTNQLSNTTTTTTTTTTITIINNGSNIPIDKNNLTSPSNTTSSTTNTTINSTSSTTTNSITTNSTNSTTTNLNNSTTINSTNNSTTNPFLNTTSPQFQPLSPLEGQLLNSSNPYHKTLIQILYQLRLFFSQQIKSSFLKQFSIKQFTDGQYYHLGLQNINSTDGKYIYFYDLMVFRCNLTQCSQYNQNLGFGSIIIVNFNKYQIQLADSMVKRRQMVNYLTWNQAQGQSGSSNATNRNSTNIFFTNGSSTSSTYYLSPSQSLSILSLFQRMISTQSTSINYTASFSKYQKYFQYLFQYRNLILGNQINNLINSANKKLITKNDITSKIINVINFVRQKYSVMLNETTPLIIVQQSVNPSLNDSSQFIYTLYLLAESVDNNSLNNNISWTIYRISVNTREITFRNVQMRIVSMNQFAKNGVLLQSNTSNTNLNLEQASYSSSDIAFGYSKVLLSDAMNDVDIQYVLSYIKSIYPSYFYAIDSTLKQTQKLQLKNGTINYKFIFSYPSNTSSSQSQKQLKIIAVYKKQLKVVQILNKVYSLPTGDSSSFRPATASQTSNNNTIWTSCVNLIYQLHTSNNLIQKQISINQKVNVLMVQISQKQRKVASANSTSYLGQTYKIIRYRVQFMTAQLKKYSIIIEYNPQEINSFSQIYFSQIVEVMKDVSYRLSEVQQADFQTYRKLTSQQIADDPLYMVAENKLKQVATYYCKTLQVMKKAEGFGYSYKIVFLGDSLNLLNNLNGNTTKVPQVEPTLMFQTIVFVQPINSIVQIRQSPQKLDLTNNFDQSISKTVFNETDLNNIALNISNMISLNTQLRQQIFFSQGGMKQFLDGFMIKFTFYVNRTLGRTQYFQVLVFKRLFETKSSLSIQSTLPSTQIWNLKPTNFATFQSCSQTSSCTACSNPSFYSIFNNICFLRIANCLSYSQIDIKAGTLKCGICMPGYQLFDDRCIAKQNKVDIFVL